MLRTCKLISIKTENSNKPSWWLVKQKEFKDSLSTLKTNESDKKSESFSVSIFHSVFKNESKRRKERK